MQIQIILPPTYDFSTADECAIYMADATASLAQRLKSRVEHNIMTQAEADNKLHLYRSITAVLDAVLAALDDNVTSKFERQQTKDAQEAVESLPPGVAKPSATEDSTELLCHGCGKFAEATKFLDGRQCPVKALQADFFSCPACGGFNIHAKEI